MQAIQDYNVILNHYIATQSTLGRWRLRLHVGCQRCVWRWHVVGGNVAKRLFDIVASSIFLVVFGPLYFLIALAIWLEDGRPVFFTQIRVGQFGREFRMYKFRSMCHDAEAKLQELLAKNHHREGVTFKIKNDPRLTHIGKWLRKLSFDELPQVWNVLKCDMSLVGPRPPVPREVAKYSLSDRRRLAVKPGITCLWQIGGRSEIDFSGQVRLDVDYIETQSFWQDVKIIVKTVPAVASCKGAC